MSHQTEWERQFESEFNKRFGFGIWDSRAKDGHRSEGINSSDVLEFAKSFTSTLIAEERKRMVEILEAGFDYDKSILQAKTLLGKLSDREVSAFGFGVSHALDEALLAITVQDNGKSN